MKKYKKLTIMFIDLLIILMVLTLALYIISMTNSRTNKYSLPGVLGANFLVVKSGSMNPWIKVGDMVIIKKSGLDDLKKDDIITYTSASSELITHRILDFVDGGYITKGDANNSKDELVVTKEKIIGRFVLRVPYLGYLMGYAKTNIGIAICIAIPSVILFLYFYVMLMDQIRNLSKHRKMILRKRRRRGIRYREEGSIIQKRAVI